MTAKENNIKESLMEKMGDKVKNITIPRDRRMFVLAERDGLVETTRFLVDEHNMSHLATISCTDDDDYIEVLYHLLGRDNGVRLTLKGRAPKDDCWLPSITGVIPGAFQYEAEVWEMMGVDFKGHPNLVHIELPDDWGDKGCPLRKDWVFDRRPYDE